MNKIYIYDTSKGFSLFMKYHFAHLLDIKACGHKADFNRDHPSMCDASFFILNSTDDFILFQSSYASARNIFVSSPSRMLEQTVSEMELEGCVVLDYSQLKSELLQSICNYLIALDIISVPAASGF